MRSDTRLPLEPGQLDRKVTVYTITDSAGSSGFPVETDNRRPFSVWMKRDQLKGIERMQAGELAARFDTTWLMPYRADMDPDLVDVPKTFRLQWQERYHDIVSAEHVGRKDAIQLLTIASSVVPT